MVGSLQYVLNYELISNKRDSVYRKSIYKHYLIVKDTIESTIEKVDFDGNGIRFFTFWQPMVWYRSSYDDYENFKKFYVS